MKTNFIKKISVMAVAAALTVVATVGTSAPVADAAVIKGRVVVAGSSALLPLTLQAAKEFKKLNPMVSISAAAAGSITGPQSVKKGSAQIGACDWDASTTVPEFKAFTGLKGYKVAAIPFATIVHSSNPVKNLSAAQLKGIFTGTITNWKDVGGNDAAIVVVNRTFGSGTRVNYQLKALGSTKITKRSGNPNYIEVKASGDMSTKVGSTPNAIGYIDLVYVKGSIKALSYNGVAPTTANCISKKYPVWGFGYYMTNTKPTAATTAFIKYVQSAKFQQGSVKKMKFIPITSIK